MWEESKVLWQVGQVALFRRTIDVEFPVEKDVIPKRDATALGLEQPKDSQ